MLMNSSRRYLPLSLGLLLAATTVGVANAESPLDPYDHIKPPASAAPKRNRPVVVPQMDEIQEQSKTYISMPMGPQGEEQANAQKKGILGKTMAGVSGIAAPFKAAGAKSGQMLAASGGVMKKSGTKIGTGFRTAGDKVKDSTDSVGTKIAGKPKKQSASQQASVDDWYTKETERAISSSDNGKRAAQLVKQDATKTTGMQTAFLQSKNKKGIAGKLNPFGKLSKKGGASVRPESGFLDAASNPDQEVLADLQKEKARIAAEKKEKNEKFTPIVDTPEDEKIAAQQQTSKHLATKPAAQPVAKKSKFGAIAKFKPQMPGMPGLKKGNKPASQVAAAPKKGIEPVKKPAVERQVAIDPREENDLMAEGTDTPAHAQPSMAFHTGDKEIDGAAAKAPATHVNKVAAKKNKLQGISGSFSKFNILNRKKQGTPAQTATKQDATKQM